MQQKTHDFLVRMRVPMATFGGDLMGEAIDFAIQEMRNNRFVTLTDIENVLSDRFHCSASSADALENAKDTKEMYANVLKAMAKYNGVDEGDDADYEF